MTPINLSNVSGWDYFINRYSYSLVSLNHIKFSERLVTEHHVEKRKQIAFLFPLSLFPWNYRIRISMLHAYAFSKPPNLTYEKIYFLLGKVLPYRRAQVYSSLLMNQKELTFLLIDMCVCRGWLWETTKKQSQLGFKKDNQIK